MTFNETFNYGTFSIFFHSIAFLFYSFRFFYLFVFYLSFFDINVIYWIPEFVCMEKKIIKLKMNKWWFILCFSFVLFILFVPELNLCTVPVNIYEKYPLNRVNLLFLSQPENTIRVRANQQKSWRNINEAATTSNCIREIKWNSWLLKTSTVRWYCWR